MPRLGDRWRPGYNSSSAAVRGGLCVQESSSQGGSAEVGSWLVSGQAGLGLQGLSKIPPTRQEAMAGFA